MLQPVDAGPIARITVTNRSESALALTCSGFWVERQTIEGWELARSPACAGNQPVPLDAGASVTVDLEMNDAAATYRATVHVSLPDGSRSTAFHTAGSMP